MTMPSEDEHRALGMLLSEEPKVQLGLQHFPARRVVLLVVFGDIGGLTIPFLPEQARELADGLIEYADELEAGGTGEQN